MKNNKNLSVEILFQKDFFVTLEGVLNPVSVPAGTRLISNSIVNNGNACLAYKTTYNGRIAYVKPLIGYVQVI